MGNGWPEAFRIVTTKIRPSLRMRVLEIAADLTIPMIANAWLCDGKGCFWWEVYCRLTGTSVDSISYNSIDQRMATAFGVTTEEVWAVIRPWDETSGKQRRKFRLDLAEYLHELRETQDITAQLSAPTTIKEQPRGFGWIVTAAKKLVAA